jgi:2-dehydropantoate 2-reductase
LKIAVIGGGAIGSVYAGLLATDTALDVRLLTRRRAQREAVERDGVRVDVAATASKFTSRPRVLEPGSSIPADHDAVLIAVKAYDMEYAAELAARLLGPTGIAVPLANGIGHYEAVSAAVGQDRAVAGATFIPATYLGPGRVRREGRPEALTLLGAGKERQVATIERLRDALNGVGLKTRVDDDIEQVIWLKLAAAMCGPVAALVPARVGVLASCPPLRELIVAASAEAVAVALARGINVDVAEARRGLEGVLRDASDAVPSMLGDVLNGRPTEIDARSGAIVALGRELGVATPVNDLLHKLVKGLELTRADRLPPAPSSDGSTH